MTQIPIFTKNGVNSSDSNPFGDINVDLIPKIYIPYEKHLSYENNVYWNKYIGKIILYITHIIK
jgi:hypothetical protein